MWVLGESPTQGEGHMSSRGELPMVDRKGPGIPAHPDTESPPGHRCRDFATSSQGIKS